MSGDIHVLPQDLGWAIAIEGTGRRTLYATLEAAVAVATEIATSTKAELLIYGHDGQICDRSTFGYAR